MSYYLFLDDERTPQNVYYLTGNKCYLELNWVIVKNFDEFVKTIEEKGIPLICSMDHDLKDTHYYHYNTFTRFTGKIDYELTEGTGYECAKWLINNYLIKNNLDAPKILIHTQNPIGKENIKKIFENYNKLRDYERNNKID